MVTIDAPLRINLRSGPPDDAVRSGPIHFGSFARSAARFLGTYDAGGGAVWTDRMSDWSIPGTFGAAMWTRAETADRG